MDHCIVKLSCYPCTLILPLGIIISIFLHGTDHRHSFGTSHNILIKAIFVHYEDCVVTYRYLINHYKSVSIIGVVNNTIIILCIDQIQDMICDGTIHYQHYSNFLVNSFSINLHYS